MFKKNEPEVEELEAAIALRITKLDDTSDDPEKDKVAIENLDQLIEIEAKKKGEKKKISRDTIFSGVVSFVCLGMLLIFEKSDVLSSKASNSVIGRFIHK